MTSRFEWLRFAWLWAALVSVGCGSAVIKNPDGGAGASGVGGAAGGAGTAGHGATGGQGGAAANAGGAGGKSAGGAAGGEVGGAAGGGSGAGVAGSGAGGSAGAAGGGGKAAGGAAGSGSCTGDCCQDSDCGSCQSCSSAHVCTTVKNQADPSGQCAGTCDSNGVCKSKKGQSCTATSGGCLAGTTCGPDGYCCNQSCGTDATCAGTCAGRSDGSCVYPSASCGTASCSGTNVIARGTCANGACQMPAAAACTGGFICSGTACKTSCSGISDCVSGDYCSGNACLAQLGAGQVCTTADQCASGLCGGRCCNAGVACTCPVKSNSNLLQNAGFDTNISGWTVDSGSASVSWRANDVKSCPFSGALHIDNTTATGDSQIVFQCVSISMQTTYDFGVYMQSSGGYTHCDVEFFPSAGCQGVGVNQLDDIWLNVGWSGDMATTLPSGSYTSAKVYCWAEAYVALDIDMIYLTPSPGTF
jgi:hypothetical protein